MDSARTVTRPAPTRILSATIVLYTLALVLFRTAGPRDIFEQLFTGLFVGGVISLIAFVFLLVAATVSRAFSGCFIAVLLALTAMMGLTVWVIVSLSGAGGMSGLGILYILPFAGLAALLAYPVGLAVNGVLRRQFGEALRTAGPLVLLLVVANAVAAPFYFSDASQQRILIGSALTVLAALVALALALAAPSRFRVSIQAAKLALGAAIVLELSLMAHGLPNPPTETVVDQPLVLYLPRGRDDLLADVPAFKARVALITLRSGIAPPAGGLPVRFVWVGGPDDFSDRTSAYATVDIDRQARIEDFALQAAYALIGTPEWDQRAEFGYISWAAGPADAERDADIQRRCNEGVAQLGSNEPGFAAPYVLAERRGGAIAARALHDQMRARAPTVEEWGTTVTSACTELLRR